MVDNFYFINHNKNINLGGIMINQGTKTLKTNRLILRKFKIADSFYMFNNWANSEKVTKFLTWKRHESEETTKCVIKSWIKEYKNKNFYQWAIVLKELNQVIGSISVVRIDEQNNSVNIGYCLGDKWWRQGIMTESLNAVIDFLFKKVGVSEITSTHDVKNPNSGKVMEKCKMKYVCTKKGGATNNRGVVDIKFYNILRQDYLND